MKAYVELIQRRERDLGTDVLTHQKVRSHMSYDRISTDNALDAYFTVEWCRVH
jgi:isocitrate lyase